MATSVDVTFDLLHGNHIVVNAVSEIVLFQDKEKKASGAPLEYAMDDLGRRYGEIECTRKIENWGKTESVIYKVRVLAQDIPEDIGLGHIRFSGLKVRVQAVNGSGSNPRASIREYWEAEGIESFVSLG